MPDYALYGGILRSALELPEFARITGGEPDWVLRPSNGEPPGDHGALLGKEDIGGITVWHYRRTDGYRIEYEHLGLFDVLDEGREIVWHRPSGPVEDAVVGLAVAGRVLATALHSAGALCLHASAVAFGDRAIAFIAPKFHGKSTLALALRGVGAQLVTDDMLPVELGPPVMVRPGVQNVRLFRDSLHRIDPRESRISVGPGGKHVLTGLAERTLMLSRARLVAVHVLQPAPSLPGGLAVRRERLADVPAALMMVVHAKLGAVLGRSEGSVVFDRAARIARSVPVYNLHVARDYALLPEVVAQLRDWYEHVPVG